MSSNPFSFWNGQPLTGPVYPQMGDAMGYSGGFGSAAGPSPSAGSGAAAAAGQQWSQSSRAGLQPYPSAQCLGMHQARPTPPSPHMSRSVSSMGGDYGAAAAAAAPMAPQCSMPGNYFGGQQIQYEPCIENGEAFCAYNGMDMNMNCHGGSGNGSSGMGGGAKGDFW